MSGRYKQLGTRDEVSYVDGDAAFTAVDMRQDPSLLQPGIVAEAVNLEFRQGVATPRQGFQTRPWAHELGASFPWDFPFDFDEAVGFGKIWEQ